MQRWGVFRRPVQTCAIIALEKRLGGMVFDSVKMRVRITSKSV